MAKAKQQAAEAAKTAETVVKTAAPAKEVKPTTEKPYIQKQPKEKQKLQKSRKKQPKKKPLKKQ